MKDLQIFDICIWKMVFQINHVSNYFRWTNFVQFHTNQTTIHIKLVYSGVLHLFHMPLYKDINFH